MPPNGINERTLTAVDDTATPFGCCNYFDRCTDEVLTLHYRGSLGLLDWMGFEVSDECYRSIEFINFTRPEQSGGTCTAGHIGNPCDDPNGFEFGTCKLTVEDFGRYGRHGPVRTMMQPKLYCKTDPKRRLDGTLITDEREWDMRFAMDVLLDDIRRHMITGNSATAGQFDGLQQWVATGYDCAMLDSIVIDWNSNPMTGGAGITWNGNAVAATWDFIDVLLAAYRRIRTRISWAATLSPQQLRRGDMILVMPSFMITCLLDFFTCWSVCAGSQYNEVNLQTYEARQFRTGLLSGLFGFGEITLDGFAIPLMAYDWELIGGPTRGDIYLLTGSVGSNRIWEGEHLSASQAASDFGGMGYFQTDGGRVLGKRDVTNECYQTKIWMHPRLFCRAPWAQVRFQDVACAGVVGPMSPDPCDTSFYPETSFSVAEC